MTPSIQLTAGNVASAPVYHVYSPGRKWIGFIL